MRGCLWWIWNQGPKKMFGYNSSAIKPSVNTGNQGLTARHTSLHASALTLTLYHTRPPRNTSVCLQEASSYKCPRSKSSLSFNSSLNSQGGFPSRISNIVCDVQLCTGHRNGRKIEIRSRSLITVPVVVNWLILYDFTSTMSVRTLWNLVIHYNSHKIHTHISK